MTAHRAPPLPLILICGCLIAVLTFGPRSTMGFLLTPMTNANGWSREIFALAIAIQNLAWGAGQPFAGLIADRFGTWKTLTVGALVYALALALMAATTSPLTLQLTAGVLLGLGIAGSAFYLVLAAFARLVPPEFRTTAFGFGTAAGSLGQLLFAPLGLATIDHFGYANALLIFGALVLLVPALAIPLRGVSRRPVSATGVLLADQSVGQALREAFGHRSFQLLTAGFFVCGFHVAFVTTHLPPYLVDKGLDPHWGAWALGLIGAFNIAGSLLSGQMSARYPKRWVLSAIYFGRAIAYGLFWLMPVTPTSVILFAAAAGFLWLSTVPPTNALVGVMFGTRYLGMLTGIVFFSHQIGAFLGVWLGGRFYAATGSYDGVWAIGVLLGLMAGFVHLPIVEQPVERPATA